MALYLTRCATVVSLSQMEEDYTKKKQLEALDAPAAAPEAPVADCAGTRFPRYNFATVKRKFARTRSVESICVVPDVDNSKCVQQRAMPPFPITFPTPS
jgi:hypothetical protein